MTYKNLCGRMPEDNFYLKAIGISEFTLIGEGQECTVYDLGNEKVLKLLKNYNPTIVQKKKALHFATTPVSFPLILEAGPIVDRGYIIEKKLSGIPFSECLKKETNISLRQSLLYQMLEIVTQTSKAIDCGESPYQELVAEEAHPAESWSAFFSNRVRSIYEKNRASLDRHTSLKEGLLEDYLTYASSLFDANIQKSLVHGDYWPPNILVDGNRISAVVDFNDQTLVGDFRLDVASAVLFSRKFVSETEMDFLKESAVALFGKHIADYISLYSIYYALQFIGVETTDKNAFLWAVEQFRTYR